MNCEHCRKEMYNTPVDGWFHKREQDAIDCFWWQKLTDKNSFLSYGNPRHTPKKYKASVLVKIKDKNGVVSYGNPRHTPMKSWNDYDKVSIEEVDEDS